MKLNYYPVNDGYGIEGFNWRCDCGKVLWFPSPGDICSNCDFQLPDIDPDDWYDQQMSKPKEERDWNK